MLEHRQVTSGRIQSPQAGDGRRLFMLIQLRIQVNFAGTRAIGREDDAVVEP